MRARISSEAADEIRGWAAGSADETCGLLLGRNNLVEHATLAANVAADPARAFEIDPVALFAALRAERAGGTQIMGYWHSHPSGDVQPSRTDAAMAAPDGKLWLIAARGALSAWRAVADGARFGRFDAVALEVVAAA